MDEIKQNLIISGSSTHDVLRLFFENGPQRQGEIAKHLKISKAACNQHMRKLVDEGLLEISEELVKGRGAPSQVWTLANKSNYFIGVLFYKRMISISVIDFSANPIFEDHLKIEDISSAEEILDKLGTLAHKTQRKMRQIKGRAIQTFVAIEGEINSDGTCVYNPNFPGMSGINFEKELVMYFGANIFCDTSHNVIIMSETNKLPQNVTSFLLSWDEGISGSVTSNNQILNWADLPANRNRGLWNVGHIPIVKGGEPCFCGLAGCLEAYTGGRALVKKVPNCANVEQLIELVKQNDAVALKVVNEAAELLASSLYWLIELFGVEQIIVRGSFSYIYDQFEKSFKKGLEQMHTPQAMELITVSASVHSLSKMRHGTALVARHFFFYPEISRKCRGVYHRPIN